MTAEDPIEPLVAFLDANIILEGAPAADLPWDEVAPTGTIRVLIVPKAMEEIDAKKRDGRLGPHARAFNRLIAPSVLTGHPVILRVADPRVELQMATCSRIPWESYDELDPDDGDSRIVAEAINARNVNSSRRILISHDIKPLAYARGRRLPVHQASDRWLRQIEPSPKDKEIQRLKQQVIDLKKDQPSFEILIEVSEGSPVNLYKVFPLSAEQEAALITAIRAQNGRTIQHRNQFSVGLSDYDSSYDEKYDHYVEHAIPTFVSAFGSKIEMLFNQRLLSVRVKNVGQVRADHLVVSVRTSDGWLNKKIVVVSPAGPRAPTPEASWHHRLYNIPTIRDLVQHRVQRHEFETIRQAKRSSDVEEGCEDFRSGQEYLFEGAIMPTSDPIPTLITVSITASNLRGELVETFQLNKNVVGVPASALIDFEALRTKQDFPIKKEMERLIGLKQYHEIEWDREVGE